MEHLGTGAARTARGALRFAALAGLVLLAVAFTGRPVAAQTFDEAVTAYDRGDYATAFRGFFGLAKQGDAVAQFNLGVMYDNGRGVPQDYGEAERWYRRAAEQNVVLAQFNLGLMYYNGEGIPHDYIEAANWYRRAAEQGHADAQLNLGAMYRKGEGIPRDDDEAATWYRRAAEQGNAAAQFNLGHMHSKGEGVPRDSGEAATWYRRAAEQGVAAAQFNLGFMYGNGEGVPQDDSEAERWYRRAAEQGNVKAQFNLGVMYDSGEGVPQDYVEAAKWYRRAAEQGDAGAQFNLGFSYRNGEGVPQDYIEAAKWYRRAAEQGDASAQFNLGLMYRNGEGVPRDDVEAARWYRHAAEQGNASAQFNLGLMYRNGEGVPRDDVEAARWYRRAAEQGNAIAQVNLALMYALGEGVLRDDLQAHMWINLAAEQGDAKAQFALGLMYRNGESVSQDYVRAHMWLNLAASSLAIDTDMRERAREYRDAIARRFSPEELARAQRMAHEWRPRDGAQSPPPPDAGADSGARQRMAAIQRALARLGYDPGPANGIAGPRTRAAVRAFQAAAGLPVDGLASERLESAVLSAVLAAAPVPATRPPPSALELSSTGSGFRVSAEGHILTNAHVVEGCAEARVPSAGAVAIAARDEAADLALLKAPAGGAVAAFRQGRGIRPGAEAVVVGYPLRGALASGANVTVGNVSALAGPGDDRRLIQITAPVQPGHSGGPVLDSAGNAVGVVVSRLERAAGGIPQNVNFAVSAGAARAFLDSEGVAYDTAPSGESLAPDEVAAKAAAFTVLVECWN